MAAEKQQIESRLRSFDVLVEVRYTFPQWNPAEAASPGVINSWQRYEDAIKLHEKGHARFGREAAARMLREIVVEDEQAASRSELKASIDARCRDIVSQARTAEVAYDKQTDHGRTQGARLEPPHSGVADFSGK